MTVVPMSPVQMFATACSTVASVLLVILAGAIIVTRLTEGGAASLKGIGYVTGLVALPCLLYTRLASRFDAALFFESYPVMIFSVMQVAFGALCAQIGIWTGITPREYGTMAMLALICQNAVAFPYSLLSSIRGVSWYNGHGAAEAMQALTNASVAYGETLLYVFNIWTSLALWSIGNRWIQIAAEKEQAENDPDNARKEVAEDLLTTRQRIVRFIDRNVMPAMSIPVRFSLLGIIVGLIPPLRWLLTKAPVFKVVFDGMSSAGDASIPLTMMVLGCSLGAQVKRVQKPNAPKSAAAVAMMEPIQAKGNWKDFKLSQLTQKAAAEDSDDEIVGASEFGMDTKTVALEEAAKAKASAPPSAVVAADPKDVEAALREYQDGEYEKNIVIKLSWFNPFAWSEFTRFTLWVLFIRSIVMPIASIALAFALGMMPSTMLPNQTAQVEADLSAAPRYVDKQRVMLLVMLIQAFSPAAVQAGIIVTLHGYHQDKFSLMLAVQYVGCVIPCVFWLFAGFWLLG